MLLSDRGGIDLLKKYKEMNVQAKASIWFLICSLSQRGISFLTAPLFTRILSTEEYGIYSLYLSWSQILTIITTLYLSAGTFTNAMNKYKNARREYLSSIQGIPITITFICLVIYLCNKSLWQNILGLDNKYVILLFIELFFAPAFTFWAGFQRFTYHYKTLVFVTLAQCLLNPLIGFIGVYTLQDRALGRIIGGVIASSVFGLFFLILNYCKGKVFFYKEYWIYSLKMAFPLLPHYLSGVILNQGDRVVISKMCTNADVALYSVAYTLGMLVQIVTNSIGNAISPWIYEQMNEGNYKVIKKKINFVLILFALVAFLLMLVSPELIIIFGKEKYADAVYVIPPVAASTFFVYLYSVMSILQFYYEKTGFMMIASVCAAVINILLNVIFVPKYGFVVAGYTTLVCYMMYCVGHHIMSCYIANKYNKGNRIYDIKFIFTLSIAIVCGCVYSTVLMDCTIVRYLTVAFVMTVLYIKKELIFNLLQE